MFSADTTLPTLLGAPLVTVAGTFQTESQPRGNVSIVFLGDSITWGYQYGLGAPVWQSALVGLGAADYGVIGATTQSLLYQLSLGQLLGDGPSVVVLTIGTNNLLEGDGPDATAEGVLADVAMIHRFEPRAEVLVLGVPPGGASPNDPYRTQVNQTNALIAPMLVGDSRAMFANIAPAFEDGDGSISGLVMFDAIHPTTLGYANLTLALMTPLRTAELDNFPLGAVL
ncbi:MAG TPA: GDSL-type esterase/lipase family protein [Gemmataceae bacterium]|jgi:lysophospholipase L1-like esterase